MTKIVTGKELLQQADKHRQEIMDDAVKYAKEFDTYDESVRSHIMKAYEDGRLAEWEYISLNKNRKP